jgi:NAD(P)H-nitrite reductase large subunit
MMENDHTVATLVERLRNVDGPCEHRAAKSCGHCNLLIADVLVDEAADALESKDAEIERLRADKVELQRVLGIARARALDRGKRLQDIGHADNNRLQFESLVESALRR